MIDLQPLYNAVLQGQAPIARSLVQQALDEGVDPQELLDRYLVPAMDEVGRRFEANEYFVPELLIAGFETLVAGGVVWVVGRANDLFSGGLTQTTVRRELWCRGQLSQLGQSIATLLRGVDLWAAQRPPNSPNLVAFANPDLLTPRTRRILARWRDEALRAQREHDRLVAADRSVT